MITTILLSATPLFSAAPPLPAPTTIVQEEQGIDERMKAAGEDVDKLWALAEDLKANDKRDEWKTVLKRIIEIDASHEGAHKGLRHHFYDGKWFESYAELSIYRREEAKRMLEEHGLVRFNDEWVPQDDVVYLRMGWVKDEAGRWASPNVMNRQAQEAKYLEEGYQLRADDGSWVHPDDFTKWSEGLWQCGEEWVTLDQANEYHGQIGQWWALVGDHYTILGTNDWNNCNSARWWADQTYADLVRAVGVQPKTKPEVIVLNSTGQYNNFAGGDQASGRQPTEATGSSSIHYAYFSEAWFDVSTNPPEFRGVGVCYWEPANEQLAGYGQHAVRHAAALSYMESIDPSWNSISLLLSNPGQQFSPDSFWAEKKIPRWLRYGIASYCERYFHDKTVGEDGNPWWARDWAFQNLRATGDLQPLEEIFAFNQDVNNIETSNKLINEAGLLVAYMLDGDNKQVKDAHAAFKAAFRAGEDTTEQAAALQEALVKSEKKLRRWAKL